MSFKQAIPHSGNLVLEISSKTLPYRFFELSVWVLKEKNFLGLISTSRSILALIAILANHPELQTRMQQEIDQVLGNAEPRLEDKEKLPCECGVLSSKRELMLGACRMLNKYISPFVGA